MNQSRRPPAEVVLVSMPFGSPFRPSLGLSLLKAGLQRVDVTCTVRYFGFGFAERIGRELYVQISNGEPATEALVGDWIFSPEVFVPTPGAEERYISDILGRADDRFVAGVIAARKRVHEFLDECLAELVECRPAIVGFTSLFQQHTASLAMAKLVKRALPQTFVVFGGPNCEGEMGRELVRQFSFVDAVISGEADVAFPQLVATVRAGADPSTVAGVITAQAEAPPARPITDLDSLPVPDFHDFFEQADMQYAPQLLFESSRGCWWGEKHQCTFCGLNGLTMQYRSKSIPRAVDELVQLTQEYGNNDVFAVDNILDMRFLQGFFQELARRQPAVALSYEVKANLTKAQLRLMRDGGVRQIQPGIESLNTSVLRHMRKGVSALQNIQLLKWCQELGVAPFWNVLWGFPDELPEAYARTAALMPFITHLPPPATGGPIRLDRFSPNFDEASAYGLRNVTPHRAYRHVFALPSESLRKLAYYFEYERPLGAPDPVEYTADVRTELERWRAAYPTSFLFFVDEAERLLIWDLRPVAQAPLTLLEGFARELYLECDQRRAPGQLTAGAEAVLEPLVERGLVLHEDGFYLSLALRVGEYRPPRAALDRVNEFLQTIARQVAA